MLVQLAKQLKVCAAGKTARLVHSRLCSDARMYQTITSGLMAGSAGEAAEGVVQPANAGAGLGAQAVRDGGLW